MEEQVAQGETLLSEPSTTTEQWYGDEYKEVVEKKGWKAPTDALKSYVELERTFSGRVKMPTQNQAQKKSGSFTRRPDALRTQTDMRFRWQRRRHGSGTRQPRAS